MESSETFRHRILLSRISAEPTPAVVQENSLAVRKRLSPLPKAIAVSSLFTGMILPTCSQRAQRTKYNMKLGKARFFVPLPSPHDSNTGYDGESRVSHIHCRIILRTPANTCSRMKIFPILYIDVTLLH